MNRQLRPKLLQLKPGTRVVAHDYSMGEWDPDEERTLLVPEKTVGDPGKSYVYFYLVPARVAGRWESEIAASGGKPVSWQFSFEQNFQRVHGTARIGGRELPLPHFRVAGERIAFNLAVPAGSNSVTHRFSGWVKGDAIEGTVTVGDGSGQRVMPWRAKLLERGKMQMGASGATVVADGAR